MSRGLRYQQARAHVMAWVRAERRADADRKYSAANEDQVRTAIVEGRHAETLDGFLAAYIDRARVLGLDTPGGRQALAKAGVTILDFLEHAVVAFGDMPEPGHSSGEIRPWAETIGAPPC